MALADCAALSAVRQSSGFAKAKGHCGAGLFPDACGVAPFSFPFPFLVELTKKRLGIAPKPFREP